MMEENKTKYYDEFALNCVGCGWLRHGEYVDGMPYLSCMWYGTIMHGQSGVECKDVKSPEEVKEYLEKQKELAKERTRRNSRHDRTR